MKLGFAVRRIWGSKKERVMKMMIPHELFTVQVFSCAMLMLCSNKIVGYGVSYIG